MTIDKRKFGILDTVFRKSLSKQYKLNNKLNKTIMKKIILLAIILIGINISCTQGNEEQFIPPPVETPEEEEKEEGGIAENCSIINKDGLLIIEAESFDLKGKWRVVEDTKASGGKYIEYYGPNSYNTQNLAHEITVKFKVDKASKYLVKWYMRQPEHAEGDKSNDVWMYFEGDIGLAWVNDASVTLNHYEKFVSRGKIDFTYGGALDLHNPKSSSWLNVEFPDAGEYTLKICARSEFFQLDKMVLSSGITNDEAAAQSKTLTETLDCE
jgi:hypothetical protein